MSIDDGDPRSTLSGKRGGGGARSIGATALVRVGNVLAVGLTAIVFARSLGPAEYGAFIALISAATIVGVFSELGLGMLLSRELAGALATDGLRAGRSMISEARRRFATINAVIIVLAVSLAIFGPSSIRLASLAALVGVGMGALNLAAGVYRGFNKPASAMLLMSVARPVVALVLALAVLVTLGSLDIASAMAISVISVAVSVALAAAHIRTFAGLSAAISMPMVEWGRSQMGFMGLGLLQACAGNLEPAMLTLLSTPEEAGFFRVAFLMGILGQVPVTVFSAAATPRIATLWAVGKNNEVAEVARQVAARSILITVPLVAIAAVTSKWFIPFMFGIEFRSTVIPAILFLVAMIPYSAVGMSGVILSMIGAERWALAFTILGYSITALLLFVLASSLGAVAGVIGSATGLVLQATAMHLVVRKKLGNWCLPTISDFLRAFSFNRIRPS